MFGDHQNITNTEPVNGHYFQVLIPSILSTCF